MDIEKQPKVFLWSVYTLLLTLLLAVNIQAATSVYNGTEVSQQLVNTRPIAVMFPTDASAQPQYGIGSADVLYEILEEGNMSRQMGIVSDWVNLPKIGNIRSCRNYYTMLSKEWDAILVHFGGVPYMKMTIDAKDLNNISGAQSYGSGGGTPGASAFFRTKDKSAPHNAYTTGPNVYNASKKLGYKLGNRMKLTHVGFGQQDMSSGLVANKVSLAKLFPYSQPYFQYDASTGQYKKYLRGKPQTDGNTGKQLTFSNVIVYAANHKVLDKKGYLDVSLLSNGSGWFITKGKAIEITWSKKDLYEPTIYRNKAGSIIKLSPGHTYIGVVRPGIPISITQ